MTQCKQVKQQEWHPKYSIQSLFYMQVTMELHRANDWGGRQHDSPTTPLHTHTNCSGFSYFGFHWPQLWKCSVGAVRGNYAKRGKENKGAKENEKRGK